MSLISIVTPVYHLHNTTQYLGSALKSIQAQSYSKNKLELVIIGDACIPRADCIPAGMQVKVYSFKQHVPLPTLRNKGVELSSGEFIAFLDADGVANKDWLLHLIQGFNENDIAGCAGAWMKSQGECVNKKYVFAEKSLLPFSSTASVMFKRQVLIEANGFDDNLLYKIEDLDLCWRICLKGYRIKYVPKAIVLEDGELTWRDGFLAGMAGRSIDRKYRQIFGPPSFFQYFGPMSCQTKKKESASIFLGYIFEFLKERFRLARHIKEVDLTEKYLSQKTRKMLNIRHDGMAIYKPNYVVWWHTQEGCRLVDLKRNTNYYLEHISKEIWQDIMDGDTQEVIVDALSLEYDVEKNILNKDFEDLVQNMCEKELLVLCSDNNGMSDG